MSKFSDTVLSGQHPAAVEDVGEGKFDARLVVFENGERGLVKTKPFATNSYRGIPKGELPKREVAMFVLDQHVLDFGVVPETVLIKWHGREASIQKWVVQGLQPRDVVPGLFDKKSPEWKTRIAKLFTKTNLDDFLKVVLLDLITNNVDRHGRNILVDPVTHKVWAIDNGLSFGRYYRGYRSVFHKYLYFRQFALPEWAVKKLKRITREDLGVLEPYLPPECIDDTWLRIKFILDHKDRLAYARMGRVTDIKDAHPHFPSYEDWFKRQRQAENADVALVLSPQADVDAARP